MIKKYEFWHPRVFEFPFYLYLGWQCLLNGISIRTLAKANYALDHGEIGMGSKLESQFVFDQERFMPSVLLPETWPLADKKRFIFDFVEQHQYPVILKSNVGCVGKGLVKINCSDDVDKHVPRLLGDFILQDFCPHAFEYGVFYIRKDGVPKITGINTKHFPTVTGNGKDDLMTLARQHHRHTHHWDAFLQDIDTSEVLPAGEKKRVSFIGSHTLGCKFTDDTGLLTAELENAIFSLFDSQPGYNFGRIDVKCADQAAFQRGEFIVIEVNGVASLPTHMFDPGFSVWHAYKIFFQHARYLAQIAREHRHERMQLGSYREVIQRIKANQQLLNKVHLQLMGKDGAAETEQ